MKKLFIFAMVCCLLVGCFPTVMADSAFSAALDMTKWQYNASDDVYWQVGMADPSFYSWKYIDESERLESF